MFFIQRHFALRWETEKTEKRKEDNSLRNKSFSIGVDSKRNEENPPIFYLHEKERNRHQRFCSKIP